MSELFEAMVGQYLSCNGKAFVCPQYDVTWDADRQLGGASPDFVVLDFRNRDLVIVEVTGGASIANLLGKVAERERRWYVPIREKLVIEGALSCDPNSFEPRFLGFVRRDNVASAQASFSTAADVHFKALEDVAFGWAYWDHRQAELPGFSKLTDQSRSLPIAPSKARFPPK